MKENILKNNLAVCILSAILVTAILSSLFYAGFLQAQSLAFSDLLYGRDKSLGEIVIVAVDDDSISGIGRWPWSRDIFAEALQKLSGAEIVGIDVSFLEDADGDKDLEEVLKESTNIILAAECSEFSGSECTKWLLPKFDHKYAAANIYVDNGIARSIPSELNGVKSLSKEIADGYLNKEIIWEERNYIYFHEPYQRISFSEVITEDFDKSLVEGKIVLIGATAKNLHDEQDTPVGVLPGVEIHANAVQSIISNKFLEYQSRQSVIFFIALLSMVTALSLYWLRPSYAAALSAVFMLAYFIYSIMVFDRGVIMNLIYPPISAVITYFSILALYYTSESRERKWLSSVFGKYVSDSVAKEIMEKGADALMLKGTKKQVTTLFADIRGFTAMSEKMAPEEVVSMLNKYLSRMTDIIFDNGGTLDKYVGDEIMATFNVPLDQKNHAFAAVKTAIEMQKAARKMGTKLKYGIGINTGLAVAGNIGSTKRLSYTVIGDSVNLASRLCSAAQGNQVLISDSTYHLVKSMIKAKKLDPIKVKGKEKPIEIYEVLGINR